MSLAARVERALRLQGLRDFTADICMCQGPPERVRIGHLVLTVCVDCGKATRERAASYGSAARVALGGKR